MNLKPNVGSNLLAASINPRLPSLIKSPRGESFVSYCLATLTTNLKFLLINSCNAFLSPKTALLAHSASSCGVNLG
jgi:hypothetical protein